MSWISIILTGIVLLVATGAGWILYTASRQQPDTDLAWFRLLPVGAALWGERLATEIQRERFLGGLGHSSDLPEPLLAQVTLADRQKELFGSSYVSTLVGVPAKTASRVSHAAAGCGVVAVPCTPPPQDKLTSPLPETFTVQSGIPWKLGLTVHEQPLALNPVPGATIALLGTDVHIANALQGLNWPEQLATVIHTADDSHDGAQLWREAWNPGHTRVVARGCSQEQLDWAAETLKDSPQEESRSFVSREFCDRLLPGIIPDVIIILRGLDHHGLLVHRTHRQAFTPLTYRSTSSSLRTARVTSALAASSSSAG